MVQPRSQYRVCTAVLLLALAGCAGPRPMDGEGLYDVLQQAGVEILVQGRMAGSGWVADGAGLVVTAAHVVRGGEHRVEVMAPALGRLAAEVVAVDRGHDLALLKLPARAAGGPEGPGRPGAPGYPALAVAERSPGPGAKVLLFGGPLFRHDLILSGRVARRGLTYEYLPDQKCYVQCYHIAGPSPMGTSGACWADGQGRVVGSQSGYISSGTATTGVAFAAPAEAIRRLVTTRQSARTPSLGAALNELWEAPTEFIARFPPGTTGVRTVEVFAGGAAARAGLNGDSVIVTAAGRPVRYRDDLLALIGGKAPGEELALQVLQPEQSSPRAVVVRLDCLEEPG